MKQQIMDRFPGIGCAWADGAGKETTEYYGFADTESRVFVDERTIFPACSVSKFITAICVMKLHEQKLININMPVNRYLRQWKLLTADGTESDADIRSILCHTAGIQDGEDAFCGLRRGDPEISLPESLTAIGEAAFFGCTALREIALPAGLTTVESYTFYQCLSLRRVSAEQP